MKIDDVIDLIEAKLEGSEEGEPNMMKNAPSQDPEEEFKRVEDDIEGNSNDLDELSDEDDDYPDQYDEMGIASEMVDRTLLDQDNAYQAYFRTVMKKHKIEGIRGLSPEKRSAFFKDVSSGWKNHPHNGNGVKEQYRAVGFRPNVVSYKTKSGTPVKATSMAHSILDPDKTVRAKKWGTKKRTGERIGRGQVHTFEQELYEEYKKYFNYMLEQCEIDDFSVLTEEDQVEFMGLVNEAFLMMNEEARKCGEGERWCPIRKKCVSIDEKMGGPKSEQMHRPGEPIQNPMDTYGNTINKMKNQLRPERRERERRELQARMAKRPVREEDEKKYKVTKLDGLAKLKQAREQSRKMKQLAKAMRDNAKK